MPQVFKIGPYIIYFWADESKPLEPIHVHVAEGTPQKNATKIWITQSHKTLIANNDSKIPERELRKITRILEANIERIVSKWLSFFEEISYYC